MKEQGREQSNRRYDAVISIAVHERPDIVVDQLLNIRHFFPNALIVLHISKAFNDAESKFKLLDLLRFLNRFPDLILNPSRLETRWGDILHVILSNFHLVSNYSFKYFIILNSNELFVRRGVNEYLSHYDAGMFQGYHTVFLRNESAESKTAFFAATISDQALEKIMHEVGSNEIHLSQPEGLFFKKEIIASMVEIIDRYYDHSLQSSIYPREEAYFSTIISSPLFCKKNLKIGKNISYRLGTYNNGWNVTVHDVKYYSNRSGNVFALKAFRRNERCSSRVFLRRHCGYENELYKITRIKVHHSIVILRLEEWMTGTFGRVFRKIVNCSRRFKRSR